MASHTIYNNATSKSIQALPFAELGQACIAANNNAPKVKAAFDDFVATYYLKKTTWLYPQVLAHVGKWTLSRNESALFSPKQMLRDNVAKDALNQGIYYFCTSNSRAVASATKDDGPYYCALVPLILAAHKKMNGVLYSQWDPQEVNLVVNSNLYEAMDCEPPEYTVSELLQFRVEGLTTLTGEKAGTLNNAITSPNLNGLLMELPDGRAGMKAMPKLARIMLCQTWCAHPSIRNEYMILDPNNWDRVPEALVLDDPIAKSKGVSSPKTQVLDKLPWD